MARKTNRNDELSKRPKIRKRLLELYADVQEGFINQAERSDDQMDYWDIYNCKLGDKQYYNGNSHIYVPIVHNAVNARKTRFVNQIFPKSGRYVDVVSEDGKTPHAEMALLEHYVRKANLKNKVVSPLIKNGDIEGQYNCYVYWSSKARHVVWKETKPVQVGGMPVEGHEEVEDIHEDIDHDEYPDVEVLADADVLILPVTCDTVEEALEAGGSYTVIRRWGRGTIRKMIEDEEITEDEGERLIQSMDKAQKQQNRVDPSKEHADAAGIKAKGKHALIYETWTKLKVDGIHRLTRSFFGGEDRILGTKLNPYWNDRCPGLSIPGEKVAGTIKGISPIRVCAPTQYYANDIINEGADSATYSMLPIIMTDPAKNPKVGTMILDLAAVWETSPNDTQFAKFPALWKDSLEIVQACTSQIFQTLSVNPSMVPQSSGKPGAKRNQAEIAMEQQVDILTTADAVSVLEEGILTPILERFAEYDAQFRNSELTVRQFGQMGLRAKMESIPPLQMGRRYAFVWFGVEQARTAAQIQQQTAALGTVMKIPPDKYPGRKLDLTVPIERLVENAFGPRDAPLIFKDVRDELAVDPKIENEILKNGFPMPVNPLDDDRKHIREHTAAMQRDGDPHKRFAEHVAMHVQQMQAKSQAMAQAGSTPQAGATGGGGPAGPEPRPGAQPAGGRPPYQPPGAIHQDRMASAGSVVAPRKT